LYVWLSWVYTDFFLKSCYSADKSLKSSVKVGVCIGSFGCEYGLFWCIQSFFKRVVLQRRPISHLHSATVSDIICGYSVLQCVAVCCSVLQCVAVCCSVLQCVAVCCCVWLCVAVCGTHHLSGTVCCSVLQCVVVYCIELQCVARIT